MNIFGFPFGGIFVSLEEQNEIVDVDYEDLSEQVPKEEKEDVIEEITDIDELN